MAQNPRKQTCVTDATITDIEKLIGETASVIDEANTVLDELQISRATVLEIDEDQTEDHYLNNEYVEDLKDGIKTAENNIATIQNLHSTSEEKAEAIESLHYSALPAAIEAANEQINDIQKIIDKVTRVIDSDDE